MPIRGGGGGGGSTPTITLPNDATLVTSFAVTAAQEVGEKVLASGWSY